MRALIYKRTHTGDPDPAHGIFGEFDCMGEIRGPSVRQCYRRRGH